MDCKATNKVAKARRLSLQVAIIANFALNYASDLFCYRHLKVEH